MRQSIKISVQPMKKILMMVALMAMSLTVSAQDVKTYEFEKFTAVYPADFELNMVWGECWGFKIGDDHLYEVVIDPYCTTLNGLKDYGDPFYISILQDRIKQEFEDISKPRLFGR